MNVAIATGSAGLVGAEATRYYLKKGWHVVGIDNDMRSVFFGEEASTTWQRDKLVNEYEAYEHAAIDIRDADAVNGVFEKYGNDTALVIHTAAQPSHDWAASDPIMDFTVNANGTLVLLEAIRLCEEISGKKMNVQYSEENRIGDHIWWISGVEKFKSHYPEWSLTYDVPAILREIYQACVD